MYKRFLCLLLAIALLPVAPVRADDDDDAGPGLSPPMQWNMAYSSWGKRQYDDAASLMMAYATANPDEPNAIEAWWYTYEIYRAYRPKPERRKLVYDKATTAAARWVRKYTDTNKERASLALYYEALMANNEGFRAQAISLFQELAKKLPGTTYEQHAYWNLAEWMREARRFSEAATYYQVYRKVVGITEYGAIAAVREGWCHEELKNKENAIQAYKDILTTPYNWGWWNVVAYALDAAQHLKAMKEDELCRALALKVIDKAPPSWTDFQAQARALLGESQPRSVTIMPHLNYTYTCDRVNIDGQTKLSLVRDLPILVRLSYITKDAPFKGKFSITPKMDMDKKPENMTAEDGAGGKTTYTADIVAPDANGGITSDWWYKFTDNASSEGAPDNLNITRKWTKQGPGWGECTIRIQSTERWFVRIYLPNDKTNPNNLSNQPNVVEDGGKTFLWYNWYDMTQGFTVKFPVEVGGNTEEYYPRMRLERYNGGRFPNKSGSGKVADDEYRDFSLKLSSDAAFPWTYTFPGYTTINIDEVSK